MNPKLAVIGLGNIGGGVARNLAQAGHSVHCADLDPDRVAVAVDDGCFAAHSSEDAVVDADVVFTSLPGPKQLLLATNGPSCGFLGSMKPGSLWVELSTNNLETAEELAVRSARFGVGLVDAPVSGGPEGAQAGTLSLFVGGAARDVAMAMPFLEIIGTKIDHLGAHGAGIVAKIAQVTLCYTQTVTLIEALLLGVKGGIAPTKMLNLIQNSAGRSYVSDTYGPEIVAGTYDPSFPLSHAAKDMRLAMELAGSVGADLGFMAKVNDLYQEAEAAYGPSAAHLVAAQIIEEQNHVILHQTCTTPDS